MHFLNKLANKRALVSGAGQGIGKAIAKTLLLCGCDVVIHYHTSAGGANEVIDFARSQNRKAWAVQADLTRVNDVERLIAETVGSDNKLDILINNAGGIVERRNLQQLDTEFIRNVFDINLSSMMLLTQHAIPFLANAGQSSIVNVASLAGRKGGHNGSLVYSTAKGAVITWTRALSTELADQGVRVNCVAPGLILGTCFHEKHTTPDSAMQTIGTIPLSRAGNVDDVARAVAFLASEFDGFITGATLDINGGVYAA